MIKYVLILFFFIQLKCSAQVPFVGEIRAFAFGFIPRGWAPCDGQLIPISQNTALFSLLGTNYGGDGKNNFALPNLNGKMAVGNGQGSGLANYSLGETFGVENVTLTVSEIPSHTHNVVMVNNEIKMKSSSLPGNTNEPKNASPAVSTTAAYSSSSNGITVIQIADSTTSITGGAIPHSNLKPVVSMIYCIALQGSFPLRP